MYENIYGLSCVENQVLAQLRAHGMELSVLYAAADISFESLFDEMVVKGTRPEYFTRIPRIQDILKDRGVISLERKDTPCVDEIIDILVKNEYTVFVKIRPEFVKQKLYARGLRDDHCVFVEKTGDRYTLHNDIPETTAVLSECELREVYAGSYFMFKIIRSLSENDILYTPKEIPHEIEFPVNAAFLNDIPDIGQKFRNFMWIYKTLVYRFTEYNNKKLSHKRIKESREYADNIFAFSEYLNLKKSNDTNKYCTLINEVYTADYTLKNSII